MANYAGGNARVGLQVDGAVTIMGGLYIGIGDEDGDVLRGDSYPPFDDAGSGFTAVQDDDVNIAGGDQVVGVQHGGR